MRMSLLDIVQSVLSDMNSDAVSSIGDTIEAEQVAMVVRDVYHELLVSKKYLDLKKHIVLQPSNDADYPTYMTVPSNVGEIIDIRFRGEKLEHLDPEDFLKMLYQRQENDAVFVMEEKETGMKLHIINNFKPLYWTSFNDSEIILDAWYAEESTTLLSEDVVAYAEVYPSFSMTDNYVPQLPLKVYPMFLAEVKSKCFADIKQMPSAKEEQKARRLSGYLSRQKNTTNNGIRYPDYGRK